MKHIDRHVYGPWALVTGASSGIGAEFARQIAASGINVVLVARSQERLRNVAASLQRDHHVETRTISIDLGRDGILDRIARATDDLDVGLVVSNAGAGNPGPFVSLPLAGLREIVQLNVLTHLELAHHFGRRLTARGRGGLVLVSAAAGAGGLPYMANDSATKAYPLSLGEALHEELAPHGVDVTVLVPVLVKTPVVERIGLDAIDLPVDAISAEEAVDEAFTALLERRPTSIDRERLTPLFADMKGAVVTAISDRIAASRPAH
jgi:short-subunit dehydrogenase